MTCRGCQGCLADLIDWEDPTLFEGAAEELSKGEAVTGFICEPCRDKDHGNCHGGTWCACQHRRSND